MAIISRFPCGNVVKSSNGLQLRIPQSWRDALSRHPRIYSWLGLSAAMVVVILVTSLGARPGTIQMLFLALVGVILAGATVALIDWDEDTRSDGEGDG